jgi:uncharacterized protein YqhQ
MPSEGSPPATEQRPYIGGQAVIEGVMMRSPRSFSVLVRRRSGALTLQERAMPDARKGVLSWPFVRGDETLVEALRLGSQALRFSAELYEADLEEAQRDGDAGSGPASGPGSGPFHTLLSTLSGAFSSMTGAIVGLVTSDLQSGGPSGSSGGSSKSMTWIALVFALLLFVALPQAAAAGASKLLHVEVDIRSPAFQAITGVFKLIIVIGYMLVIRRIHEIRRVFMYHGAEHKAIATYEANEDLAVEFARTKSRLHPRCGTTFLVMVVFVSIFVFSAIGPLLPKFPIGGVAENVLFFLMKLPFLPLIASITYEIQRFTARYCLRGPLRFVLYPGFAVQGITTIEPDDAQLEVALASLRATLWWEQAEGERWPPMSVTQFRDFSHLMDQPPHGAQGRAGAS